MVGATVVERETARVMDLLSESVERAIRGGADPDELAAALTAAMPSSFDAYGPFYDTAGLTMWLGISRQAVEKRAAGHRLLAVKTTDRHVLYPTWQFDASSRSVPQALRDVLQVLLPAAESPWTVAAWLRSPPADGEPDAIARIAAGESESVLRDARRDAERWSR